MSSAPLLIPLPDQSHRTGFAPLSPALGFSHGTHSSYALITNNSVAIYIHDDGASPSSQGCPNKIGNSQPTESKLCTTPFFIPFEDEQPVHVQTQGSTNPALLSTNRVQEEHESSANRGESKSFLASCFAAEDTTLFGTENLNMYDASLSYSSCTKYSPILESNASRIADCVYRSVLKIMYASVVSGLTFGVPFALFDAVVRFLFRIKSSDELSFPSRAIYCFMTSYVPGLVYYSTVALVEPIVARAFAHFGQRSCFLQVRSGYAPLFWSEDLPEVLMFSISAAFFEVWAPPQSIIKGGLRSALGTSLASIVGELYRHMSSSFRSDRKINRFSPDAAKKLNILSQDEEAHRNFSMGLVLGASGVISMAIDMPLQALLGTNKPAQAFIQAFNFFSMMVLYELAKRFPGQPSRILQNGRKFETIFKTRMQDLLGRFSI